MSDTKVPLVLPFMVVMFMIGVGLFALFAVVMRDPGPEPMKPRPRGKAARGAPKPERDPDRRAEPAAAPAEPAAVPEPTDRRRAPGYSGIVVGPDGRPVAGAVVIVYEGPPPRFARLRMPEVLSRAKTDEAGRFRLLLSRPTDGAVLRASSGSLTTALHRLDARHVGMLAVGVLRLQDGIRLTGRILDEAGQVLPGTLVLAGSRASRLDLGGRTDAEGRFDFVASVPERLFLATWKAGFHGKAWPVLAPTPGTRDLGDVVLTRAETLRVRVVAAGTPWPGPLEVVAYPPSRNGMIQRAEVPESGLVEIPVMWPGPANVVLLATGELSLDEKEGVRPGGDVVELAIPETEMVEGVAVDAESGEPVEVIEAGIVWGGVANDMMEGGTLAVAMLTPLIPQDGAIGTFRIPRLDFRRAPLILKTATHGIHGEPMVDLTAKPLRIEIPAPISVEVIVSGLEGEAVAVLREGQGVVATTPVVDGSAVFESVPPLRYSVEVVPASPELARSRAMVHPIGEPVNVTVVESAGLRGRVVDESGATIPWMELDAARWAARDEPRLRILTDAKGSFALEGLVPGKWSVHGTDVPVVTVEVAPGETAEILLRRVVRKAVPPTWVEGRVRPKGVLAVALDVWLDGGDWARSKLDGSFRLRAHPGEDREKTTILVGVSRMRPLVSREIEVVKGRTTTVDIEVTAATLRGRVVDAEGRPLAGAILWGSLEPAEGFHEQTLWGKAGGNGSFQFHGLGKGTVRLAVYRPGRIQKGALIDDVGEPDASIAKSVAEGIVDVGDVVLR